MNRTILLTCLCFLLCGITVQAQRLDLGLAVGKTTSLIFPYAIHSVDRGSGEILAQVPEKVGNVLQVKAARQGFPETNLTVITADGKLYSFRVVYDEAPSTTCLQVEAVQATPVHFTDNALDQQLEHIAAQVAGYTRNYYGVKDTAARVKAILAGIYIHGNTLFYKVVLTNASPVPYDIDFTRFTLRDRKQVKRTATQEEELVPFYIYGQEDKILEPGYSKVLVFALPKHTLARSKELVLNLFEKDGGRHLSLKIRVRHILQAGSLPL